MLPEAARTSAKVTGSFDIVKHNDRIGSGHDEALKLQLKMELEKFA